MTLDQFRPDPVDLRAPHTGDRRWYCVAYADSCTHTRSRSALAARMWAGPRALPGYQPATVTPDTCSRTGLSLPILR